MGLIVIRHNEREPAYRCDCCADGVFFEGEERAYETHVVLCSMRHDAELRGESLRVKAPGIFDPEQSGDAELDRWVRRHRVALLEDRMRI
jgi:hypothetical protein